jgi:hypothetical protein
MDNQPSFDRELLLPILLGGFSILGIIIILLIGRLNAARASVIVVETQTPFKYIFLGTEPINPTESPEASETELLTDIPFQSPTPRPLGTLGTVPGLGIPTVGTPAVLTPNNTASPVNGTSPVNTSLPTTTSASGAPLGSGTYDDLDSRIVYDGPWLGQTDVAGAYQGTLHVSQVTGSSLTFRFIGRELRLFYQGNPSQGQVTINIDGQNYTLDQSNGNEWISDQLTNNTHTVLITHLSGGSVNLDYAIIPEVALAGTPTATPTTTLTP